MEHGLNTDFQNLESVFHPCSIRGPYSDLTFSYFGFFLP